MWLMKAPGGGREGWCASGAGWTIDSEGFSTGCWRVVGSGRMTGVVCRLDCGKRSRRDTSGILTLGWT